VDLNGALLLQSAVRREVECGEQDRGSKGGAEGRGRAGAEKGAGSAAGGRHAGGTLVMIISTPS
jgi:hypothetical protein